LSVVDTRAFREADRHSNGKWPRKSSIGAYVDGSMKVELAIMSSFKNTEVLFEWFIRKDFILSILERGLKPTIEVCLRGNQEMRDDCVWSNQITRGTNCLKVDFENNELRCGCGPYIKKSTGHCVEPAPPRVGWWNVEDGVRYLSGPQENGQIISAWNSPSSSSVNSSEIEEIPPSQKMKSTKRSIQEVRDSDCVPPLFMEPQPLNSQFDPFSVSSINDFDFPNPWDHYLLAPSLPNPIDPLVSSNGLNVQDTTSQPDDHDLNEDPVYRRLKPKDGKIPY